jgi:hypothetical protein
MSEVQSSIFIMKNTPQSLKGSETYLKNRQWTVYSAASLKEAVAIIIQKQPEFVMVSADHPNKKVRILPKLLAQAFSVKIILYSETTTPAAMISLRDMNQPYVVYPPVSGPAIERMLLKMQKDSETQQGPDSSNHIARGNEPGAAPKVIQLKGEAPSAKDSAISFEQARLALSQLIDNSDDESSGANKGNTIFIDQSLEQRKQEEDLASWEERKEGESFEDWQKRMQSTLAFKSSTQGGQSNVSNLGGNKSEKPMRPPGMDNDEDWDPHKLSPIDSGGLNAKKGLPAFSQEDNLETATPQSIVQKGVTDALEKSVVRRTRSAADIQRIENSSHMACIIVDSSRFSGYLVAALGKDRKIDKSFLDAIKDRLFVFLRANGEQVKNEESMEVKLQEVKFESWALEQAEFLRKSIHDGDEIAMAFFPNKEVEVKLTESASEKMVSLNLNDLKDDTPVEFDLYMYLPSNNKYLLYTPQGMPFYKDQKNRLQEKGVAQMHLRKESAGDVKRYRAQNFLNEKIAEYKKGKQV